jgi:hypothetical protein
MNKNYNSGFLDTNRDKIKMRTVYPNNYPNILILLLCEYA